MKKLTIALSLFLILGTSIYFGFSYWYLWTENSNFKALRKKSELNCQTMPYHCAIKANNISNLNLLKSSGLDIDSRDLWNRTALIYTIQNGYLGSLELIENGANVNLFDEHGESALAYALQNKNFKEADLLVSHGAEVNFKIRTGKKNVTLLTNAIIMKNKDVAKYLISKGASIELKDGYGYNACERVKMYQLQNLMNFINCPIN